MVWQHLVTNWLRQKAMAKVQETVTRAARDAVNRTPSSANPNPQPAADRVDANADDVPIQPCDALIVLGASGELGSMLDRMRGVVAVEGHNFTAYEGGLAGRRLLVVEAPADRPTTAQVTQALIEGHEPKWVLAAGFAIGLNKDLRRGDIVMANGVTNTQGDRLDIDLQIDPDALRNTPGVHIGTVGTYDDVPSTVAQKQKLAASLSALAADADSFTVARTCRHHQRRCLVIRVLAETLDQKLPEDIDRLLHQESLASKLGAATGALFRRPGAAKDLWKLREDALAHSDRLAAFLDGTIRQLIPQRNRPS